MELAQLFLLGTGWLLVRTIGGRHWRPARVAEWYDGERTGIVSFESDGQRVITDAGMTLIGIAFWAGLLLAACVALAL